jgi:hypothetical protein
MCILSLSIITACDNNNNNNNVDNNDLSNSELNVSINEADTYTELDIFGATIKFKKANPTYFWDCDYNYGAAEIDTVYIVSENGKRKEDYHEIAKMSSITFSTLDDVVNSESTIKNQYKRWYNVDVTVENIEHKIYKKHIKGENSEIYIESYAFKYDGIFEYDPVPMEVYYGIYLEVKKDDYSQEELNKIIAEYHLIIDTLEFVR